MRQIAQITTILFLSLGLLFPALSSAASKALLLNINGPIGPAAQDYVERGIQQAEDDTGTGIVIIQLNTPGGLETSMRGINTAILNSHTPVISYVAPAGARAASAGIFIMYASHLSLMAPGTNAGAASPVHLTGHNNKEESKPSTESTKAMNDASAYIRSLAQLRHRNVEWAELAVTKAASVSAEEAKKLNIINDIADNYPQLLEKIDGKSVTIRGGNHIISTQGMQLVPLATDWRHDFLSFITNPNIVYLLILGAVYGLFFEFSNPGLILPGIAGVICLLLALYAMQLLPVNYAGLSLILVGITFMTMEVYISSYGSLAIGGIIAFILGSIMLFDTKSVYYRLNWHLIVTMGVLSISFFFVVATIVIRAHKKAVVTGKEGLIGANGTVVTSENKQLIVRVAGELWEASSSKSLDAGDKIRVKSVKGLVLRVEKPTTDKK